MQRRRNPNMKEVVRSEVIKLLDNRIIYPISDSKWVSPTQVVPKNFRVTVITNEKNEFAHATYLVLDVTSSVKCFPVANLHHLL